jgi:hypothetical protein
VSGTPINSITCADCGRRAKIKTHHRLTKKIHALAYDRRPLRMRWRRASCPNEQSSRRVRSHIEREHSNFRTCLSRVNRRIVGQSRFGLRGWNSSSTDCFGSLICERSSRSFFSGLKLLQETETGRSGRAPRSAVLGHAETLLAAMRHILAVRWKASARHVGRRPQYALPSVIFLSASRPHLWGRIFIVYR